jgi:thiol-disulfide isomerase/thioredoxin
MNGEEHRLDAMRGRTVVLYLWATWCLPCQRQLPLIEKAYAAYGSRPNVAFLAVSVDQRPELVKPFVQRHGYTVPVTLGDRELYARLDVQGLPTLLIVDPQGVVRFRTLGHSEVGDFVEELGWRIEAVASPEATGSS